MIKIKVYAIIFKIRFLIQSLQVFCKPLQADQSFLRDSSLCEDSQRLGTETNIINYLTLLWSSIVSFILIEASFSWVRTLNSLVSCADFNSATESSIFLISSVISLTVLLSASSLARISSLKLVFIFSTSVYHKKHYQSSASVFEFFLLHMLAWAWQYYLTFLHSLCWVQISNDWIFR